MFRLAEIRRLSQKHATKIAATPIEPDYSQKGPKENTELLAHAAFILRKAAELADRGYLLRATHAFGFAEGVLWAAGVYSIAELRTHRSAVRNGSRTGFLGFMRRTLYRTGDWFYQFADRV